MKVFTKLLEIVFTVFIVIHDMLELLALPILFLLVGIFNALPWQYYVITIGGYFVILAVIEIVLHFYFKHWERKYTPALGRLVNKIDKIFTKKSDK